MPLFLLDWYHRFWPLFGAIVYRFPSKKLKVIGITGTNGKTTVTHLAADILTAAGYKVASISSLRLKIGEKEWKNELKMTMPGRMIIQKFLKDAVDSGCTHAVIEVTSEGIRQHRHDFIDFDVAVFTNLTPEHIERHGGFENYKKAKGELFKSLNVKCQMSNVKSISQSKCHTVSVVNRDDENAEYFLQFDADEKYLYGFKNHASKISGTPPTHKIAEAQNVAQNHWGIEFSIDDTKFHLNLPGEFNAYNALAAICVGFSQGVAIEVMKQALKKAQGIPGRMETVIVKPFRVIVDYAHTPDALEKAYKTILESGIKNQESRMICVLGAAGGGRDKWKRPELGKIAADYCDQIILTNEDPYNEDPMQIIKDVQSDARNSVIILDRREAIKKALRLAKPNDVVIITGKGAEPWLMTSKGKIPWDDRAIVKEEIALIP